ncbi:nucleoside diphosphate kinase regulator [Chitinibacter tainanensis]|uniref:nucleoside diphosphate kinase regulator n=1 Tax=Chitinibacter tainanensis TaxID=230667 RepID=UPI002352C620|nr:nucleoside diphosphate kinase regulator [Chitinibacter tainanensis]
MVVQKKEGKMQQADLPPILVSTLDYERLSTLIARTPAAQFPGAAALEKELERATLLSPEAMPASVVTMHSTVKFAMQPSGEEFALTLCYPHETAGDAGKIAITAPMGSALLGLSVGQSIHWPTPGRQQVTVTVLDVIWQPEANGQLTM